MTAINNLFAQLIVLTMIYSLNIAKLHGTLFTANKKMVPYKCFVLYDPFKPNNDRS